MKTRIYVEARRRDARAIEVALADPILRTLAATIGYLEPLEPRARKRVLAYVRDLLDEQATTKP